MVPTTTESIAPQEYRRHIHGQVGLAASVTLRQHRRIIDDFDTVQILPAFADKRANTSGRVRFRTGDHTGFAGAGFGGGSVVSALPGGVGPRFSHSARSFVEPRAGRSVTDGSARSLI